MTRFYKLSGGGNDFIALVEPEYQPEAKTMRRWCRRGVSLGADGLFLLRQTSSGVAMEYFNSDGRPATLCINATRCAARLAEHLSWAGPRLVVGTDAGDFGAELLDSTTASVEAPLPSFSPRLTRLELGSDSLEGWSTEVGVPHFVSVIGEGLDNLDVDSLGARARSHPTFGAEGTNVDFIHLPSASRMSIRSFERGIEGETLACGTGVLAAVAIAVGELGHRLPIEVTTRSGCRFEVDGETENRAIRRWTLAGDARVVAEGILLEGADALVEGADTADSKSDPC